MLDNTSHVVPRKFSGLLQVHEENNSYVLVCLAPELYDFVKPVFLTCESELNSCLSDFAISSLPKYGAKVVRIDDIDVQILEKWNFIRDWIRPGSGSLKPFLKEMLVAHIDPVLIPAGFKRKANIYKYKNVKLGCVHNIEFSINRGGCEYLLLPYRIFIGVHDDVLTADGKTVEKSTYIKGPSQQFHFFDKETATETFLKIAAMLKSMFSLLCNSGISPRT
jgi:hypothetical protein